MGGATLFGYISWLLVAVASGLPDIDLPASHQLAVLRQDNGGDQQVSIR
ncbi:MAG: hypothetical protein IT491_12325 [Gammaproteobacteria bacterium]|nr:hypothetical protein [Gammaproteobacteria bacterium]